MQRRNYAILCFKCCIEQLLERLSFRGNKLPRADLLTDREKLGSVSRFFLRINGQACFFASDTNSTIKVYYNASWLLFDGN
jgi:hypothetical protein